MPALRVILLFSMLVFTTLASAEDLTPQKKADIEKLLAITGALAIGQQMSEAFVNQMTQSLRTRRPDIPKEVFDVLPEEINAVISSNLDRFKDIVIPLYHKYFSGEEIKQIIEFYKTPLGQKTIQVMPQLMGESLQAGIRWGEEMGPEIQRRIKSRFKKEGYEI